MNVRLHGILPEGLGMHFMHRGNRIDLSPDTPVEVDVAEGKTLTLTQDPPLTSKWKVLAALGIVITAPLQAALHFGDTKWDDVMPYRLGAVLRPTKDGSCTGPSHQVEQSPASAQAGDHGGWGGPGGVHL